MAQIKLNSIHLYIDLDNEIWASREENWNDLQKWAPPDILRFEIFAYLDIGPSDQKGSDIFNLVILSRKYYDELNPELRRKIRTRWKFIVLKAYDWNELWSEITRRLNASDRGNWPDSLEQLRRQFSWEFENMNKPAPPEMH